MVYYDRIDISGELIFIKKAHQKTDICQHWYFLDKEFKFEPFACNGCHDVLVVYVNFNDIAMLIIIGIDYRCIINGISKGINLNLLQIANLKTFIKTLTTIYK